MHSDDYAYYLMGFSPSAHLGHYLGWSGGFVTDYISSILLSFNNTVYSTINILAFFLLIYFISLIPVKIFNNKNTFSVMSFLLIFILYWIANPNPG